MSAGILPAQDSKSTLTPAPDQGMVGTPAACARMVEPILSPRAAMAGAGGPRKRIPEGVSDNAIGSSGFSEAWPLHRRSPPSSARYVLHGARSHTGTSRSLHESTSEAQATARLRLVKGVRTSRARQRPHWRGRPPGQ